MIGDVHGAQDDPLVPELARVTAPRRESDFVAPLTVGRPRWQRRYTHVAVALDAGALACLPVLYLLCRPVVSPPFVAAVLSAGVLAAAGRGALRRWLHNLRRKGRALSKLLAVGDDEDVATLIARTRDTPDLGWRVAGVCTSTGAGPAGASDVAGVPVVGDLDSVSTLALVGHYDAVSVTPAPGWTVVRLQQLARDLDGSRTALLVAPGMVQRTGPRVRVTGVDGLPLMRLDHPTLAGSRRLVKETIDRLGALLTLVLVAPVLASCAVAVRRDGGPALTRRTCHGRGGREFSVLTFRTVDGTGALTSVGNVLRRHGLEGLPQLLNVLGGSMALVGPRPVLPEDGSPARRLLVKPGLTGLGQPDRPADEPGPEQDLRYIERWSPALDARILLRTLRH